VGIVFAVRIPWLDVAAGPLLPHFSMDAGYVTTLVAVFGTTISPYLFFWQASQEVEEQLATPGARPLIEAPRQARRNFRRMKVDTLIGMGFSNSVAFFIMLTAAVALHMNGVTDIQTSAQAASALRPVAGEFAFALFALGIVGTGLLAVPVLAGSAAYAVAGAFRWRNGLELAPSQAKGFYAIIAGSTLLGIAIGFMAIDPIKALFWAAVLNGVISVPIMVVMMLMSTNREVMGEFVLTPRLKWLGWGATASMAAAVAIMFVSPGGS
jgi:Mn2+/Fe2+ NRAMP family transporter